MEIKVTACKELEETGLDVKGSLLNVCECFLCPSSLCHHMIPLPPPHIPEHHHASTHALTVLVTLRVGDGPWENQTELLL